MKKFLLCALLVLTTVTGSHAMDGKTIAHLISIPIVEGCGIYSSVRLIQTKDGNATAAAISNLSLIGINSVVGAYTLFGKPAGYSRWRTIHRVAGFVTGAAGIWLAVSAGVNDEVAGIDKGVAAGYGVVAIVPILLFKF